MNLRTIMAKKARDGRHPFDDSWLAIYGRWVGICPTPFAILETLTRLNPATTPNQPRKP